MPAPKRTPRKKKTEPANPSIGGAVSPSEPLPGASPSGGVRPRALYREVRWEDGSLRAERYVPRAERERGQALADFYGVPGQLSPEANVRSMDALLGEVLERMEVSVADFAPEVLADAWLQAVGPFLATQAELLSIARQRARIRTAHPAVRYELMRLKPHIIRALNASLGEGVVRSVQIIHG